jgi:REP element-mobilizing transposase RayT
MWDLFTDYLHFLNFGYNFKIHSFVLMSNHFHMIVRTPNSNLSAGMQYLVREVSRDVSRKVGRTNHNFGNKFFRCLIESPHYYLHAYKYVYRNPVKAKIVNSVELYKYSSLPGLLGLRKSSVPIAEDNTLFESDHFRCLQWLNENPESENENAVRAALRKKIFSLGPCPHSRRRHNLENKLL